MGHLSTTEAFLDQLDSYSNVDLARVIQDTDPELTADVVVFIMRTLWSALSSHEKNRIRLFLRTAASGKDFDDITEVLDDDSGLD